MNSNRLQKWMPARFVWLLAFVTTSLTPWNSEAAANLALWDSRSSLADSETPNADSWKPVPIDLFTLEKAPATASSDPGYYGREYEFKGDAVVRIRDVTILFRSALGRVDFYAASGAINREEPRAGQILAKNKIAAIQPIGGASGISHFEIIRNNSDEIILEATFKENEAPIRFSFGKDATIEIKPGLNSKGLAIQAPFAYGIVPGFLADDMIFSGHEDAPSGSLAVPAENMFLGLLEGGDREWVMTWPTGKQQLTLQLGSKGQANRIQSVEFQNDGQSLFLSFLSAPGIWHNEPLRSDFLEQDVSVHWKPPFPARWQTELLESGIKTRFTFRDSKDTIWRGVPGSYTYPVWFEKGVPIYHLSKKIAPKGDSLVYFVEGQDTPPGVSTPEDILKATLGRVAAEQIIDSPGRKLRTHHRRGGTGVRRACTCGCTEAIQAIFEARAETEQREYVKSALDDMIYFIQCHLHRIDEYRQFADRTAEFLRQQTNASPNLQAYGGSLLQIVAEIPREYEVQLENIKDLDYAADLERQTMALTSKNDAGNLAAYMELLKAWRGMGGAQDYIVAQCHSITRNLFQEAGYESATQPEALPLAMEMRKRCREILRNPDGYEIWPNY
jgi:hypothetical protein